LQALHHQQQLRLPLPPSKFEDEPRYVNAKQYLRIIKMREKKQQQPSIVKMIRKYKHESRHEHAKRRQRCENGRFVSKESNEKSGDTKKEEKKNDEEIECEGKDNSEVIDGISEIKKSKYSLDT
jgi:hypothetical protein